MHHQNCVLQLEPALTSHMIDARQPLLKLLEIPQPAATAQNILQGYYVAAPRPPFKASLKRVISP